MALLWAQTSAAKQAEVMTFDGQAVEAVIDVGPRMRGMPTDGTPPVPSMEAVLGNDFRSFGSPVMEPQEEAISTSHISVPLWMQTGQVSGGAGRAAMSDMASYLYTPQACSITPYRPRGDFPGWLEARRAQYYPLIQAVACEAGVPVGLFDALVAQESRYDPLIVSPKGAVGLTQLMPGTARGLGVFNSRDPLSNLRGGARYLRAHLDEFKRVDLALSAYNAGPGRVRSMRRIPPFRETMDYVAAITRGWSTGSFRTASIQTAGLAVGRQEFRGRGVQLLAYTSTRVSNPR